MMNNLINNYAKMLLACLQSLPIEEKHSKKKSKQKSYVSSGSLVNTYTESASNVSGKNVRLSPK